MAFKIGSSPASARLWGRRTLFDYGGCPILINELFLRLVASDHLLGLFVFWELTTIASYLLIGYYDRKAAARSAASSRASR